LNLFRSSIRRSLVVFKTSVLSCCNILCCSKALSSLLNAFFHFSDQTLKNFLINFGNLICHLLGRAHQRNLGQVLPLVLSCLCSQAVSNHFSDYPHDGLLPLNLSFEESAKSFIPCVVVTDFAILLVSECLTSINLLLGALTKLDLRFLDQIF